MADATPSTLNPPKWLVALMAIAIILMVFNLYLMTRPAPARPSMETAAAAGTIYTPGFQAARDGLIIWNTNRSTNVSTNDTLFMIGNNISTREYYVTRITMMGNTSNEFITELCSSINLTNVSTCNGTWSKLGQYGIGTAPLDMDLNPAPIVVPYSYGFRIRFPTANGTSGIILWSNVQYLNLTP